jgi:hypothetical protein
MTLQKRGRAGRKREKERIIDNTQLARDHSQKDKLDLLQWYCKVGIILSYEPEAMQQTRQLKDFHAKSSAKESYDSHLFLQ